MQHETRPINMEDVVRQALAVGDVMVGARRQHLGNIRNLTATPSEVEEWYFADDPLDESRYMTLDYIIQTGDQEQAATVQQELFDDVVMLARGGTTLASSVLLPEAFTDEKQWYKTLNELYYDGSGTLQDGSPAPAMGTTAVLQLCIDRIKEGGTRVKLEDTERLYVAGEMLRSAARNLLNYRETEYSRVANWGSKSLDQLVYNAGLVADSTLHSLMFNSVLPNPEADEPIPDAVRMLCVRAGVLRASSWMGQSFELQSDEEFMAAQTEAYNLAVLLEEVFLNPELGLDKRLKQAQLKGPLHEALWMLDSYMLRMTDPQKYWKLAVTPTYLRGDAPRIGHPELKRGYDYRVSHGNVAELVQLKSSKQQERNAEKNGKNVYHPIIRILSEENFEDVDPRRLKAKLHFYKQWIDSGFGDENLRQRVDKYILKTVRSELDYVIDLKIDRATQLRQIISRDFIAPAIARQALAGGSTRRQERERARQDRTMRRAAARRQQPRRKK